jgi:hypothetical protein
MVTRAVLALALAAAGCADSIAPNRADAGPPADARDGGLVPTGLVTTQDLGDGTWLALVDGTSYDAWTAFDLDAVREDPSDAAWDLGWMRASIRCNGGVSGAAGVEVAIVAGVDFAGVIVPPTTTYATDQPDGDDPNTDPDYALKAWYDYNEDTHVLTPKTDIIVVRSSQARYVKLQILAYYDDAGTAAWYLVHGGEIIP